nr:hypothetical protein [Tanacetum cinerariifolium]
ATPPKPIEGSEKSHSVSSGTVPDLQYLERNIQLAGMRFPSTLDEGTRKSQPLPKGTAKTTPRPEGPLGDKDSEGNKTPADIEPINLIVADPLWTGAEYQESDEEEVFAAGNDMEEDTQTGKEEHQEQTDKVIDASINSLDKNNVARGDILNALNGVTETLKTIQDAVKEDHALKRKVIEATEAYTKNSINLTLLLTLIKNFDFQTLKSSVESLQATALSQEKHLAEWAKSSTSMQDTSDIKSMMTGTIKLSKGRLSHVLPLKNLLLIIGERLKTWRLKKEEKPEEPKIAVPVSSVKLVETPTPEAQPITTIITFQPKSSQASKRIDKRKRIATDDVKTQVKLVPASRVV